MEAATGASPWSPFTPLDREPADGPRDIVLLGSTGSIGTQAADIVRRNPDRFRLVGLASGGGHADLLARQALEFGVEVVAVASERAAPDVQRALAEQGGPRLPKVLAGPDAVAEVAAWPGDVTLNAVTGAAGLAATLAALDAGRVLALANKESLIMGGQLVTGRAAPGQLVPVDSEHSTLAQCLRSGSPDEVRKLVLTASGGPFLHRSREELAGVTPQQALAHPTWNMGPVITVNSATLINKGLELIEAHLLFGIGFDRIEVVVHRQSVIHSMVEFTDGATIAMASPPDMRIPIALALGWPHRVPDAAPPVDWTQAHTWTFEPLDETAFPAVALARAAGRAGGTVPAAYNAANEECVESFLAGRIPFTGIVDTVSQVVSEHDGAGAAGTTVEEILAADHWARARARELTTRAS
ncbi:MAG TPA: 1-deoxy-D-xylulose-5-phosphate reductoisomerase [Streptosporangiaceae bacterium]|jgi:1-deoxy-D-xylulose-5-phosphate reductoisomerase|nr:1-deoxy-D-xylulose-5-phosphate reductoisomerase [Streptosporangiaceae bacterium]